MTGLPREALKVWGLSGQVEPITVGLNRRTWRIGDLYVSGTSSGDRPAVERELALLGEVSGHGCVAPTPVPTNDGASHVEWDGWVFWATRELGGTVVDVDDASGYLTIGRGLARLHSSLADCQPVPVVDHSMASRFAQAVEILRHPGLLYERSAVEPLLETLDRAGAGLEQLVQRPMQLVHGDPSHPNLRLVRDGEIGWLDWEQARLDVIECDLAVVAYTALVRSQLADPVGTVHSFVDTYERVSGREVRRDDLQTAIFLVLAEAIAHHGERFLRGAGPRANLAERPEQARRILRLTI